MYVSGRVLAILNDDGVTLLFFKNCSSSSALFLVASKRTIDNDSKQKRAKVANRVTATKHFKLELFKQHAASHHQLCN